MTKHLKRVLLLALSAMMVFAMTACGGGGGGSTEKKADEIKIKGEEFTQGDLTVTVPDGWQVLGEGTWDSSVGLKIAYTKSLDDSGQLADVYVNITKKSYFMTQPQIDAQKKEAKEEKDKNANPKEITFLKNKFLGYRNYTYMGTGAYDWFYQGCVDPEDATQPIIEIRNLTYADQKTKKTTEGAKIILASIKIGGKDIVAIPTE